MPYDSFSMEHDEVDKRQIEARRSLYPNDDDPRYPEGYPGDNPGTRNLSNEEFARGRRLYAEGHRQHQQQQRGSITWGENRHHGRFFDAKADELLYSAHLLRRDQLDPDADIYSTFDLVRTARACLAFGGAELPPPDQHGTIMDRALGSGDFTSFLSNVASRALTLGYTTADVTYPLFTVTRPVRDYKAFVALRGASMQMPAAVPENAEVGYGALTDEGHEVGAITSYKQKISISRQALANGDIERLTLTPYAAGQAIQRLINSKVYELLASNPTLSDSVACFDASRGNLISSGAAPSTSTLEEAATAMGAQTNSSGELLNIRPGILLAPHSLCTTLNVLRTANNPSVPGDPSTGSIVVATDSALSGTAWYAVADPARQPGIAVVVLAGTENSPRLEELTNAPLAAPDGRHFLCGFDFDVVIVDPKALLKNVGV